MSPPPSGTSTPRLALDLATLIGLIAALVYIAGWSYAERYFAHFQVGLLALEVPTEYYFVYGSWVIGHWWLLVLLGVILAWLICGLLPPTAWQRRWLRATALVLVLALFMAMRWLGGAAGSRDYRVQQASDFRDSPRVRLWLKPGAASPTPETATLSDLEATLPQGCHRLLLQNRSTLWLFRPRRGALQAQVAVLALPMAEVRALRVLPQFSSCEE